MTSEQINIAIAEAFGWKHIAFNRGWIKAGDGETQCVIPNYCNDLNAMHEAEKTLDDYQYFNYCRHHLPDTQRSEMAQGRTATAHQRAEAFLKTIGRWEESTENK
jgi:hypothetical protein